MNSLNLPLVQYPFDISKDNVELYKGNVLISKGNIAVQALGSITFKCNPKPRVCYELFSKDRISHMKLSFQDRPIINIGVQSFVGFSTSTNLSFGNPKHQKFDLEGILIDELSIPKDQLIDEIVFLIPNFADIIGRAVTVGTSIYNRRIFFCYNNLEVTIDPISNFNQIIKEIKDSHSNAFTHVGRIRITNGSISLHEAEDYLHEISCALSFSIARFTQIVLPVYYLEGCIVYRDLVSNNRIGRYNNTTHWFDYLKGSDLESYLSKYLKKMKSSQNPINFYKLLNWYIEAEKDDIVLETRIILITTALDYFSWHIQVIENGLSKSTFQKTDLAGNIRNLLTFAKIPSGFDAEYITEEVETVGRKMATQDGPELIARYRNALVHPNRNQSINNLDSDDLFALKSLASLYLEYLCLWYIEYDSNVVNRLKIPHSQGDYIQAPWKK